MEKRPELRFASAGELGRAATAAASARPVPTQPLAQPSPAVTYHQPARPAFGPAQIVLSAGAVTLLAAALIGVVWLAVNQNSGSNVGQPTGSTSLQTAQETTYSTTTSRARGNTIPGTDDRGFLSYPPARCDQDDEAVTLARTEQSVLVICRTGAASYYYRGLRLSDLASIELPNAVRSSGGFDVTNPTDGTRYEIRPGSLTIVPPDGLAVIERMVEYEAN